MGLGLRRVLSLRRVSLLEDYPEVYLDLLWVWVECLVRYSGEGEALCSLFM